MCFPLWFKWSSRRCFSWCVVMLRRWFFSVVTLLKQLSFSFLLLMHDLLFRTCLARQCTTSDKKAQKLILAKQNLACFWRAQTWRKGVCRLACSDMDKDFLLLLLLLLLLWVWTKPGDDNLFITGRGYQSREKPANIKLHPRQD